MRTGSVDYREEFEVCGGAVWAAGGVTSASGSTCTVRMVQPTQKLRPSTKNTKIATGIASAQ